MHISDNYLQSKFCQILFDTNRDVSDLFNLFEKYEYAMLKYKGGRQANAFPKDFIVFNDEECRQLHRRHAVNTKFLSTTSFESKRFTAFTYAANDSFNTVTKSFSLVRTTGSNLTINPYNSDFVIT